MSKPRAALLSPPLQMLNELAEVLGLKEDIFKPIKTFSGGMKRRLNIGIALLHRPQVIIMDEPTAALGVQETAQVENIIRTLKENGEPLILISHNMRQVFDLVVRAPVSRVRLMLAVAVADAHPLVIEHAHWRTRNPGGRGAAREVCELIMEAQGNLGRITTDFLKP